MAICKTCGKKYSKWTTPVSARGVCRDCFESEPNNEPEIKPREDVSSSKTAPAEKRNSGRIHLRSFFPRSRSKVVFVLVMSCYCITLSFLSSALRRAAHVQSPPAAFYLDDRDLVGNVISLLLLAPVIESLLLVGVFELVRRAHAPEVVQVLVAALFISEAHVWPWWPHAVIVLPAFCIEVASYLYWRRSSWKTAFWVVASIHALSNLIPALSAIARAARQS
jgi:hypothetical protein